MAIDNAMQSRFSFFFFQCSKLLEILRGEGYAYQKKQSRGEGGGGDLRQVITSDCGV